MCYRHYRQIQIPVDLLVNNIWKWMRKKYLMIITIQASDWATRRIEVLDLQPRTALDHHETNLWHQTHLTPWTLTNTHPALLILKFWPKNDRASQVISKKLKPKKWNTNTPIGCWIMKPDWNNLKLMTLFAYPFKTNVPPRWVFVTDLVLSASAKT